MQLLPYNYSGFYTDLTGHTGNPHNPTKTTTTNLSGSNSLVECGDWITRRPVPLTIYPLQILWGLIRRSAGASPSSSRILPNLTMAIPHEGFQASTHSEASLLLHTVFQPTLVLIPEFGSEDRFGYSPNSLLSNTLFSRLKYSFQGHSYTTRS